MDILIQARIAVTEYKMKENMQRGYYCCWYVGVLPKPENVSKIRNVCFTDGQKIYAEGKFIHAFVTKEGKAIFFKPLHRVNKVLPRPPASRGWCYIN